MARKSLFRQVRSRFSSTVIWAMVPLATISGRCVSGCLSPTGHFDPACQCSTGGSAVCHCRCSKCGDGVSCCCKSKSLAGQRASSSGVQNERCRTVGFYGLTLAVNASKVSHLAGDQQLADLGVLPTAEPCSIATPSNRFVAELNTGPPPDNLIVQLHHWTV